MNQAPSIFKHLRDILILPFTVTVIVPYLIYDEKQLFISDSLPFKIIGGVLAAGGLSLFLYTVFLFKSRGRGTLAPWAPTQKLIIVGPYKYCRNPMITGVLFILLGESLILHATNVLIWAGIFVVINTIYFILVEERSMQRRFGEEYTLYKKHVPRWLPRLKPYEQSLAGSQ
jgi:protein-S-isoprenylcysteine O-methyltransferase Ste14